MSKSGKQSNSRKVSITMNLVHCMEKVCIGPHQGIGTLNIRLKEHYQSKI